MAKVTNETVINVGYKLASSLVEIDIKAGVSKKKLIIQVIEKYPNKEQLDLVLSGFEKYHKEQGANQATIAVRKSEIMTVFKASLKGEHNKQALKDHQGTYHEFVSYARNLKGKRAEDEVITPKKPKIVKLTDAKETKVKEMLTSANDTQLVSILSGASLSLVETTGGEAVKPILLVIMKQAELLANTKKFSPEIKNLGGKILDIVVPVLQDMEQQEEVAQQQKAA